MSSNFLSHVSKTDVGNKRTVNEDSYGFSKSPNGLIYIVCDGMGGHVGGSTASKIAVDSIIKFLSGDPFSNIFIGLNNAIQYANKEIYKYAQENPKLKGMGTTCTVLIAREPEIFIAHVGDSRIYIHSDSKIYRTSKDHSYVQELVDKGIISDEEMESHPKKNQILKALGTKKDIEPTVYSAPIHPKKGDLFLLCSDGLNGEINDINIEAIINNSNSLESAGDELINAAKNAGGNDNITLQLIKVNESPFNESDFPNYNPKPSSFNKKTDPDLENTVIGTNKKYLSLKNLVFLVFLILFTLSLYLLTKNGIITLNFNRKINESIVVDDTLNQYPKIDTNLNRTIIPIDSILNIDSSLEIKQSISEKTKKKIISNNIGSIEKSESNKTENISVNNDTVGSRNNNDTISNTLKDTITKDSL